MSVPEITPHSVSPKERVVDGRDATEERARRDQRLDVLVAEFVDAARFEAVGVGPSSRPSNRTISSVETVVISTVGRLPTVRRFQMIPETYPPPHGAWWRTPNRRGCRVHRRPGEAIPIGEPTRED